MTAEPADLADEIAELVSAEDFLDYFDVTYERHVVQVNRLHILQRFHDYLGPRCAGRTPQYDDYRECLAQAYADFVKSDALTERVFKVLKRATGVATVPLTAIGRTRH